MEMSYILIHQEALGSCSHPSTLSADAVINMNNLANIYFAGNGAGTSVNNISIGWAPCVTPNAKLSILQISGDNNTIGEYVTNHDASSGVAGSPSALIGLQSFIPAPSSRTFYNVAGWYEADDYPGSRTSAPQSQYAIFVPDGGGTVDIGYIFGGDIPDYLLDVNGYAQIAGSIVPSDSNLKKNIIPFKYGLKAIRNLNPVSYNYNGIGGFDSSKNYIGLVAQNLQRNVPSGVKQSHIIKDTISHDTATILGIYEEAVMYTAINAIKQLDSTVTTKSTKIDSLTNTLDSLRSAVQNMQTCLIQLCGQGHSRIRNNGGGSGDTNTTVVNTQDVTLSLKNEANEIILYQNIPILSAKIQRSIIIYRREPKEHT